MRQSGFVACVAVIVGTFVFVDLWWLAVIPHSRILFEAAMLLLLWPILQRRVDRSAPLRILLALAKCRGRHLCDDAAERAS
jgi:hypothetical protein